MYTRILRTLAQVEATGIIKAVVGRGRAVTNLGLRKVTKEGKTEKVAGEVVVVEEEEEEEIVVLGSPAAQEGVESSTFRDLVQP